MGKYYTFSVEIESESPVYLNRPPHLSEFYDLARQRRSMIELTGNSWLAYELSLVYVAIRRMVLNYLRSGTEFLARISKSAGILSTKKIANFN